MGFIASLFSAILCVGAIILALIFVGCFVVIASSLDKIAAAITRWSERN